MTNIIKLKRSAVSGAAPASLEFGELAINYHSSGGKIYYKDSAGAIVEFGGGGADTVLRAYFLPPAPASVTAAAGNAQAVVSWTAPTVLVQTPITDYVVQYSSNSGSTWTTFSDGTSTATSATVTGLTNGSAYVFRVAGVNGIGTGAYSTASSAVTPIAGDPYFGDVTLLLHADGSNGSSSFTDSSSYASTVTSGGATISTAQSKWGSGSADFAGGTLSFTQSADFTGDWTIEFWLRTTNASGPGAVLSNLGSSGGTGISFLINGGKITFNSGGDGTGWFDTGTVTNNVWTHIAVSRTGSTTSLYQDGVRLGTSSNTVPTTNTAWVIGSNPYGHTFSGYLDDYRITKGIGRYTGATITVPTAAFPDRGIYEDPWMDKVALLLHADGSGSTFVDSSLTPKTITAAGGATQSSTQSKWGGKSADFSSGGYLSLAANSAFDLTGGPYAIDFWAYFTSSPSTTVLLGFNGTGTTGSWQLLYDSGTLYWQQRGSTTNQTTGSWSPTTNAWHHVAVAWDGTNLRIHVNGSAVGTGTTNPVYSVAQNGMNIGGASDGYSVPGFIDDLRITKAARYTGATITVPTAAFPDA